MATMRTPEQVEDIARRCVEIEKAGGDVLAYLSSEHYISPWGTWYNMQRERLHRKPWQITDGKPEKRGGNGNMGRFVLTPEVREQAINEAIIGGNPLKILGDAGAKNTSSLWYSIKKDLQQKDPERYEKLPVRNRRANYHAASDTAELDPEQTETETVPTVPAGITAPLVFEGFTVRCIESELGRFNWDPKYGTLDWATPDGDEICLTPSAWDKLTAELPRICAILGVTRDV